MPDKRGAAAAARPPSSPPMGMQPLPSVLIYAPAAPAEQGPHEGPSMPATASHPPGSAGTSPARTCDAPSSSGQPDRSPTSAAPSSPPQSAREDVPPGDASCGHGPMQHTTATFSSASTRLQPQSSGAPHAAEPAVAGGGEGTSTDPLGACSPAHLLAPKLHLPSVPAARSIWRHRDDTPSHRNGTPNTATATTNASGSDAAAGSPCMSGGAGMGSSGTPPAADPQAAGSSHAHRAAARVLDGASPQALPDSPSALAAAAPGFQLVGWHVGQAESPKAPASRRRRGPLVQQQQQGRSRMDQPQAHQQPHQQQQHQQTAQLAVDVAPAASAPAAVLPSCPSSPTPTSPADATVSLYMQAGGSTAADTAADTALPSPVLSGSSYAAADTALPYRRTTYPGSISIVDGRIVMADEHESPGAGAATHINPLHDSDGQNLQQQSSQQHAGGGLGGRDDDSTTVCSVVVHDTWELLPVWTQMQQQRAAYVGVPPPLASVAAEAGGSGGGAGDGAGPGTPPPLSPAAAAAGGAHLLQQHPGFLAATPPLRLEPVPEDRWTAPRRVGPGALGVGPGAGGDDKLSRLLRQVPLWLDRWWDVLAQLFFLATTVMDVVLIAYLISSADCGSSLWVPAVVFIAFPVLAVATLLLIHNGWLDLCMHWFSLLVKRSDLSMLRLDHSWFLLDFLRHTLLLMMLLAMALFGVIVTGYCYMCFACITTVLVPVLDTVATATTLAPSLARWGKQRDVLFLENYKATRLPLQALLQSLPMAILTIYILAMPSFSPQPCAAPIAVVATTLVLALINVLGKAAYFIAQAGQQYGNGHIKLLTGLKRQAQEIVKLQGACRVPPHVLEASLLKMLRSQSDFIVSDVLSADNGNERTSPSGGGGAEPGARAAPAAAAAAAAAPARPALAAAAAAPAAVIGTLPVETASDPAPSVTPTTPPTSAAPASIPAITSPPATVSATASAAVTAMNVPLPSILPPPYPCCGLFPCRASTRFNHLIGQVPLVPPFIIPWGSGQLVPGQVATIIKEAFARYPERGITTWALEYPSGDRCMNNMLRDGLSRFQSLQHLTICKCKVGGRGFNEVTAQLLRHAHLQSLRLIKVEFDGHAATAIADLVRDNPPLATLEVVGCTGIAPRTTVRLAKALRGNTRLSTLLYTGNGVNKQGAQAFADSLQSNRTLRHLDLSGNKLGPAGAAALADALAAAKGAPRLRIVLSSCDIGVQGAKVMVDALARRRRQRITEEWQQRQQQLRQQAVEGAGVGGGGGHNGGALAGGSDGAGLVWDEAGDDAGVEAVGCYGAMLRGGGYGGARGGLHLLGVSGAAGAGGGASRPASVVAGAAAPPADAAGDAAALAKLVSVPGGGAAAAAVAAGPPAPADAAAGAGGRHKRTRSEPTGLAGLAVALLGGAVGGAVSASHALVGAAPPPAVAMPHAAAALLNSGGGLAPVPPEAVAPCLRVEVHSATCGVIQVQGLPLTLLGGPGGPAALAALLPGADSEERELEELQQQQCPAGSEGRDGIELVLWLGPTEKDVLEAAYTSFKFLDGLTEIDLSGLGIGDSGAQAVADCLRACSSLAALDVSRNAITDAGIAALAAAAASAPRLQMLDLSGNQACDDGAAALATMMRARTAIIAAEAAAAALSAGTAAAAADVPSSSSLLAEGPSSLQAAPCLLTEAPDEGQDAAEGGPVAAAAAAAEPKPSASRGPSNVGHSRFSLPFSLPFISAAAAPAAAAPPPPPLPMLHVRLCDNHYPFTMDALRDLQAALHPPAPGPPAAPSAGAATSSSAGPSQPQAPPPIQANPRVVLEMVRRPAAVKAVGAPTGPGAAAATTAATGAMRLGLAGGAPAAFASSLPGGLGAVPSRGQTSTSGAAAGKHSRNLSQVSDSSDPNAGCGVCFDNPNNLTIRGCGHKLCVQCYRQLVKPDTKKGAACPFCRAPIMGFEYRGWAKF